MRRNERAAALLPWACCLLLAACGSSHTAAAPACKTVAGSGTASTAPGTWPYPNADLANTRDVRGSAISSANVAELAPRWTFKITGPAAAGVSGSGSLAANPVVVAGVVYMQDLDSNVYAIALGSGKLKWEYECNAPERSGPGPNGVAVAGGRVYGQTPTTVFALSGATGKPVWVKTHVLAAGQGTFGIQPTAADGRVYLASQYGIAPGGGILIAMNAATGAVLWKFNTVIQQGVGVKEIGVGAGGAWETPLVGDDGSVTYGIGNPYQSPAGAIAHPAAQLYTNSEVKLDAATGKLRWYYQAVPNDFKDYDIQASPIAARVGRTDVVIGAGKMGYVYEMDAATGKLLWKTAVGEHNGKDDDGVKALEHKLKIQAPYTILPGSLGGILSNMALADGSIYLATLDVPLTYTSLESPSPTEPAGHAGGEVEALNLATGKVEWRTNLSSVPLGAATVANNLVFTTMFNRTLLALDRRTGRIVYRGRLPTTTNAPIAIAGDTVIVPAGGVARRGEPSVDPQLVAYGLPNR